MLIKLSKFVVYHIHFILVEYFDMMFLKLDGHNSLIQYILKVVCVQRPQPL